ncbi:ubiquitin-conjugating enzyme E2 Z-like [Dermacentor andersoni]|uniref:ubiquitin-conjugating enzyme E2 Z-like n=1 Tax=Dermacentor andersoni TaxID=34620 RepID=UPI003B3B4396
MASQQGAPGPSRDEPAQFKREDLPSACLLRVKQDIAELKADPPPGVFIAPSESDITRIDAIVVGPADTPFEGGFFRFRIKCPSDYPMKPPDVQFLTTDAGRVQLHEHLYKDGHVCLSIIGTWTGPQWSPALSLSSLLVSLQSMLSELDKFGRITPHEYGGTYRHNTVRIAVCHPVEDCLRDDWTYPPALRDAVLKTFAESCARFEDTLKAGQHLYGTRYSPPGGCRECGLLLLRIQDLKLKVKDAVQGVAANAHE